MARTKDPDRPVTYPFSTHISADVHKIMRAFRLRNDIPMWKLVDQALKAYFVFHAAYYSAADRARVLGDLEKRLLLPPKANTFRTATVNKIEPGELEDLPLPEIPVGVEVVKPSPAQTGFFDPDGEYIPPLAQIRAEMQAHREQMLAEAEKRKAEQDEAKLAAVDWV